MPMDDTLEKVGNDVTYPSIRLVEQQAEQNQSLKKKKKCVWINVFQRLAVRGRWKRSTCGRGALGSSPQAQRRKKNCLKKYERKKKAK